MQTATSKLSNAKRLLVFATARLQRANERVQRQIESDFSSLLSLVETLKKNSPDYVAPWEAKCVSTYRPSDQRVYQRENAKDAVLKVLSVDPAKAINTTEIVRRVKACGLTYAETTIRQTVSTLVKLQLDGIELDEEIGWGNPNKSWFENRPANGDKYYKISR